MVEKQPNLFSKSIRFDASMHLPYNILLYIKFDRRKPMSIQTTYTDARSRFASLCDAAATSGKSSSDAVFHPEFRDDLRHRVDFLQARYHY